ncbi:sensor histidine kinase [Clostridium culturomicium]|uniref:sensor histidine kinase n=1 Tax=Clostridium culturomicium TaxID=1499683 RepID=UPI0006939494|nr:PAS domain-containing sensor histidine kinase [Clostridium culturomicium]
MKFDSLAELRIYDEISQPIVMIDDMNKVVYCNAHAGNFLSIVTDDNYLNKKINNIIKFKDKKSGKPCIVDIYGMKQEVFETIAEVNMYTVGNLKLNLADVFIGDNKYKMLLLPANKKEKSFFDIMPYVEKEATVENNEKFNFIDIKNSLENHCGEYVSAEMAMGIVNATSTGVVIEKNNKIIAINNSARLIIGGSDDYEGREVFLGKSLLDVVKIEPIRYKDNLIEEQHKNFQDINIVDRGIIRRDGSAVFCEITTMFLEEKNEIYYIYLIKNITKRVKLEKNLISNKNSYMKLLELLPIGVMIHTNNKFNSGNKAQARILGVEDINDLTNKDIMDMIHKDYKQIYREMYYKTFTTGKTTDLQEIKMIRQDGTIIEVEMIMMPLCYEGDKSVVVLTQEITEKKKAEIDKLKLQETLKYDKLKTEFISNVSHELKTPLNIILSTVQLLQYNYKNCEDEQLIRYLNLTKINSYRLLRLINNLIDGTRIDVGNLKMNFGNYNIVKIVEDITMEAVEYVESKGLTITFDTDVEEKIIGVDKDNIERIMLNLLSNAVKFSKAKGKIEVQIIDEGEIVKIKVRDDGKGISKEDQAKIFDKFVQVEQLFTRSHEGSGVGLSLVKSIVENHGGSIYVVSELGVGSEFTVELPNILSKKPIGYNDHAINQVSSNEKVRIEFSGI